MPEPKTPKPVPKSLVQIPTPKMVAHWQAVSEKRCDQMLAMTQQELDRNSSYAFQGMWMALLIFLILFGSAFFFAYRGNNIGAGSLLPRP
jgi:hypothetical protein